MCSLQLNLRADHAAGLHDPTPNLDRPPSCAIERDCAWTRDPRPYMTKAPVSRVERDTIEGIE